MKSKKPTRSALLVSAMLLLIISVTVFALGACRADALIANTIVSLNQS